MPKIDKRSDNKKKTDARKKRNAKRKTQPTKYAKYKDEHGKLHDEVTKLEVEQEFENMLDLFDVLDTYLPEGGKVRSLAIKRIKRHMLIEDFKGSNKIQIKEIYTEPIEWVDRRDGKNAAVYSPYLKSLLLYRLLQAKDSEYTLEWSYAEFWHNLGMRNKYYSDNDVKEFLPVFDSEISDQMLDDFFKWTGSKNKSITDYILDSLKDEGLLDYEKYVAIGNGRKGRRATAKEVRKIRSEEKRVMEEWGLRTKQEVFFVNKSRQLYRKVKARTGLHYFDRFKIYVLEKDVLENGLVDNLIDCKLELNRLLKEADIRSAEKRVKNNQKYIEQQYEEDKKHMAIGLPNRKSLFYLFQDDYVNKFHKLEEYFTELRMDPQKETLIREVQEYAEEKRRTLRKDNSI